MKREKQRAIAGLAAGAGLVLAAGSAGAAPVQWLVSDGGNGHYYEYLTGATSFADAMAKASALSFAGLQGYLATVTSEAENEFMFLSVNPSQTGAGPGYGGGSDAEVEGTWKWVAGPEAGTIFWQIGVGTVTYDKWNGGEPNNVSGDDYLNLFNNSPRGWNDIPEAGNNYYVEYGGLAAGPRTGGVPEPAAWGLMILGFAAAGATIRRRRARRATT